MEKPKDLLCLEGISCLAYNKDQTGMNKFNHSVCTFKEG